MAVATGSAVVSTNFTVVCVTETGPMKLTVIANGIGSKPVEVTVDKAPTAKIPINEAVVAHLIGSLADGPLWVLGPNGPVPVDPRGPAVVGRGQFGVSWGQFGVGDNSVSGTIRCRFIIIASLASSR